MCSNTTGVIRVSKDGIVNVGTSFLNAAPALYKLGYPMGAMYGSYASPSYASPNYAAPSYAPSPVYQYSAQAYAASYYTSGLNPLATSLSCMVGSVDQAGKKFTHSGNSI